jgi:outer membrane protein insertion porin family/translocation and assembly module TamA
MRPALSPVSAFRADLRRGTWMAALILVATGCAASVPPGRSIIDAVDVSNSKEIASGDVTDRLATAASPKFLGLFRGIVYDYAIYDAAVLQRDMARVERYYRGHGFLEAHARVARVIPTKDRHVRVEIVVDEGPPTLDRHIDIQGTGLLRAAEQDALRVAAEHAIPKGTRFDEDAYKAAQAAVLRALTDRGYAYATVQSSATADLAAHAIDYVFTCDPGIRAVFGPISFVGLDPDGAGPLPPVVDDAPLRRTVQLHEGKPFSTAEIESSTQALLDLEIFSAVHIVPQLSTPPSPVVPLVIEVQPSNLRALKVGGGLEFDAIKTEVHALVGWEDHDLLGGLRDLSIDFKPGVVLFPTAAGNGNFVPPDRLLPEERTRVQLRVPAFLEARTTGFIRPEFNVYPLLVEPNAEASHENVVGYVEPKVSAGVERRFGKHFFVSLTQNLQGENPFAYTPSSSAIPQNILLWFPQLITTLDFRDDAVHPHKGFYLSNDLQVAFGVTARDIRIAPEARGYIPLARGVTLGLRGAFGFVLSPNYGQYMQSDIQQQGALPSTSLPDQLRLDRDIETIYFRGFFSGGPTSNRGFALRGVGPYGVVPFLNPATAASQVACNPQSPTYVPSECSLPIGGLTLWESTVEVRFDVSGPLGVAVFCDGSDVSAYAINQHPRVPGGASATDAHALRFDHPHVSCGTGMRYATPVGPVRLDVGYRIPPLQVIGQPDEAHAYAADHANGLPASLFSHVPIALAFGIGESF